MIIRLRGDNLQTWQLYPLFEQRVMNFAAQLGAQFNEQMAATELRNRFATMPLAAGYWLIASNGTEGKKGDVVGHVCAWLTMNLGALQIFVWQAEGTFDPEMRKEWAEDFSAWMDEINANRGRVPYIPGYAPIQSIEVITANDGAVMAKYIERLGFEKPVTLSLMQFQRREPKARAAGGQGPLSIPKGLLN